MTDQTSRISIVSKAFNLEALQKSRLPWVDYLKGIAILLVVYRHVLIGIERTGIDVPQELVKANMIFYSFRMPLFFILSGLFIGGSIHKRSLNQLIAIKFENLLYPYLVWAFLQVSLQIIFSSFTNSDRSLIHYTHILYQPSNLDQLWYLPALFNATIIYLFLKIKLNVKIWMQLTLGCILYFVSPYFERISMISDWMNFYLFFALGDALSSFFFRERTQFLMSRYSALILVIPFFIATQLYYISHKIQEVSIEFLVIALTGCLTMFVLSIRMQIWNILRFLRVIGYHSLYIYVMHVMVAAFIRLMLTKFFGIHQPFTLLIIGIFFGTLIPIVIYNLFIKEGIAWFLFTYKKPKKSLS